MAKVKNPLLSLEARGALNGMVYNTWRGISYVKERESAKLGPIEVATERRGFIPPVAGAAAVVLGIALVVADRRRRKT